MSERFYSIDFLPASTIAVCHLFVQTSFKCIDMLYSIETVRTAMFVKFRFTMYLTGKVCPKNTDVCNGYFDVESNFIFKNEWPCCQ